MLLGRTSKDPFKHPVLAGEHVNRHQGCGEAGSDVTSVVMGVLEGRWWRKGMSGNSIIIFRGLNMADCRACDKELSAAEPH